MYICKLYDEANKGLQKKSLLTFNFDSKKWASYVYRGDNKGILMYLSSKHSGLHDSQLNIIILIF